MLPAYPPTGGGKIFVRGDLLVLLGCDDEARAEFERAAGLTRNERERALLLGRAADCGGRNGTAGE